MRTKLLLLALGSTIVSLLAAESEPAQQATRHLKVIQTESLHFPNDMKAEGVRTGSVRVIFYIDSSGRLADSLITAYTKKSFADEVSRVIPKWKFEPEYVDGVAVDSIVELNFNFRVDGLLVVNRLVSEVSRFEPNDAHYDFEVRNLKGLDTIPIPTNVVAPAYPQEWMQKGITGVVTVDFYIDENGTVRLPAAERGANPMLAGIAVEAVKQWKFSSPTYKGRPVLVHAQQKFSFE